MNIYNIVNYDRNSFDLPIAPLILWGFSFVIDW